MQAGIIRENTASRELHKKCGFREIGFRERVGRMPDGKWHDVILMSAGAKLGAFSREDKLSTEDFEMLVVADK